MDPILNSGDTAWMLISTALVILMTIPGLALFYGGLIRRENVLNTIFLSFISFAIVSILWFVYGYDIVFGQDADDLMKSPAPVAVADRGILLLPSHLTYLR